jgi:hypothetical protein
MMALRLTVQTELALALQLRDLQNARSDQETDDQETEADHHIPTDNLGVRRELAMMTISIDHEEIREHFMFDMRMPAKYIHDVPEYHTRTLTKALLLPPICSMMTETEDQTSGPEREVAHRIEQLGQKIEVIVVDSHGGRTIVVELTTKGMRINVADLTPKRMRI